MNKKIKSIICIVLAFVMVLIPNLTVFASSNDQIYGNIKISVIENNAEYSKIELTHMDTGKVEYLESFYENGEVLHVATADNIVQEIESKNDKIYISENGELVQTLDISTDSFPNNIVLEDNTNLNNMSFTPNAWGAWSAPYWTQSSRAINVTLLSGVIAIIALILAVPPLASAAVTIGTTAYNLGLKNVYYKIKTRTRNDYARKLYEMEKTTYVYQHSNYSGFLGSHMDSWTGSATN